MAECKDKSIIIFGASKAGEKAYQILNELDYTILYFIDNDPDKWGKTICDKNIYGSQILRNIDVSQVYIIIGSTYIDEISQQLNDMGLQHFYQDIFTFTFNYVVHNINHISLNLAVYSKNPVKYDYLMTLPRGFVLGGREVWANSAYELLKKYDRQVCFLSLPDSSNETNNLIFPCDTEYRTVDFYKANGEKYFDYIKRIIEKIYEVDPSYIILNGSEELYLAIHILEHYHPGRFKIISVIHNDKDFSYMQNLRYSNVIDKFICVSDEIKNNFIKRLGHREKDIFSLIISIKPITLVRNYTSISEPVRIGYVGRLEKADKRADYLIELIKCLEEKKIKYRFDIGGEGSYFSLIEEFVLKNGLTDKVNLTGGIPNESIYDFWQNKDIYVSVSDREGTSISMLEGLYNGAVPVLTDVSGIRRFIEHGNSGFIVNTGDINSVADKIGYLEKNRHLLEQYGQRVHQKVSDICDPHQFIASFIAICEGSDNN